MIGNFGFIYRKKCSSAIVDIKHALYKARCENIENILMNKIGYDLKFKGLYILGCFIMIHSTSGLIL